MSSGRLTSDELRRLVPGLREAGANRLMFDEGDFDEWIDDERLSAMIRETEGMRKQAKGAR